MADRKDPYAQFNFLLQIDGMTEAVAGFTEVTGINSESDIIEYREGNEPPRMRKLPGLTKNGNITCKRGMTTNRELWEWRKATAIDHETSRRNGSIILRNEVGQAVMRWNFINGWPNKYEAPALNSKTNEAAIESIEIVHEGLELAEP